MRAVSRPNLCTAVLIAGFVSGAVFPARLEAKSPDFKSARVLAISDASREGANVAGRDAVQGKEPTTLVGAVVPRCMIKVSLDGKRYSGVFYEDKHFKRTDLAEGEEVQARIEGNKLVLKRPSDGKEMKSKIVETGPVE